MIPTVLETALIEQLNTERFNAESYDALAMSLDVAYWPGSAAWMRARGAEEREHAAKIRDYLIGRDVVPMYSELTAPAQPDTAELTPAFDAALALEQATTEKIKMLYHLADDAADPQTCAFLVWFLNEQTESEAVLRDLLTMLRRLDNSGKLVFDGELK